MFWRERRDTFTCPTVLGRQPFRNACARGPSQLGPDRYQSSSLWPSPRARTGSHWNDLFVTQEQNKAGQRESADRGSPKPDLSRAVGGVWHPGACCAGPCDTGPCDVSGPSGVPADSAGRRAVPGTPAWPGGEGRAGGVGVAPAES